MMKARGESHSPVASGFGRTRDEAPDKVIVLAPNWLGDAMFALPAIAAIRQHFENSTLIVAARSSIAPVFELVDGIDRIVTLPGGGGSTPWSLRDTISRVASAEADLAILLPNSFRAAWVAKRAGIRERWGYRRDFRAWALTRAVACPPGRRHFGEYYLELVRALGVTAQVPLEARVHIPADIRQRAADLLARHGAPADAALVGIAPGAIFGSAKRWPISRFAELVARVIEELDATPVIVGTGADARIVREIVGPRSSGSETRARAIINIVGETDLHTLAGVLSHCRAFVGHDSGATHLAAAVGVSVTAIFGPTDERGSYPLMSPNARRIPGPADSLRQGYGGPPKRYAKAEAGPHEADIPTGLPSPASGLSVLTNPVWCRPCFLRECPLDHGCMNGISVGAVFESVRRQVA